MGRRFSDRWLRDFANGSLTPVVDSVFDLAQAAQAHRHMETGLSVGKTILTTHDPLASAPTSRPPAPAQSEPQSYRAG